MSNKTPIYQLEYFVPDMIIGDSLDLDKNRFTTIENQLFNVYNIFGNGILDRFDANGAKLPSWLLTQVPNQKSIQISSGKGHISYKYAETETSQIIDLELPPGATTGTFIYYFYASETDTTSVDKTVNFSFSLVQIDDIENFIGLGGVELIINSDNSFSITVYNDEFHGRQEISLFSSLTSLVKNHLHIGGPDNPSPIDLSKHVTGFLSSDYIDQIDLNKVTTGTLNPNRLPQINHNSLLNIGTLTHEQIDSLLASLQYPDNNYKLSDYGIVNRLQIVLALKKQSNLFNVDGGQINSIFYTPYTQMQNFVDTENTTATINTDVHRIYGVTGIPLQSNIIKIHSTQDFKAAVFVAKDSIVYPSVEDITVTGVSTLPLAGTINNPYGLTGSATTVFISSPVDSFVSSFSTTGVYIKRRIDFDPNLNLNSPLGLWYDASLDNLYIADTFNHRVVVTDGSMVNTKALIGKSGGSGVPGSNSSEFNFPKSVFGFGATFYVSDSGNNRIQKFTWLNNYPVYQTTYQFTNYGNRSIYGVNQSLSDPRGVVATSFAGNNFLFISDYLNHRVLCGIETAGIYSVYQILGENSTGVGISNASFATYLPSSTSYGSGAVFSFSTSVNGTISSILVSSPGANHRNTDTYVFQYPGQPSGIIYLSTDGVGGVSTAYASYGISSNNPLAFDHPQGLAISSVNQSISLIVSDTDNNRLIKYSGNSGVGFGVTNNQLAYQYGIGTVGSLPDSGNNVYFERPANLVIQSGFSTVFVSDSLNNRIHNLTSTSFGFSTNILIGLAATTFGIGDTSLMSGGVTLDKPFAYIGIANTFPAETQPSDWYVGEVISQGTTVQADIIDRYSYNIFDQISFINKDTIAVALSTVNEIFPDQSLGKIDCYLILPDNHSDGSIVDFNLSNNPDRTTVRISRLVTIRQTGSSLTNFNTFFDLSQFVDNIDVDIIGFGFKWSTTTDWANADYLNLGWYLPNFDSSILNANYPKVLTYRQSNGLKNSIFSFNANRYAQSSYFVFRFDSGSPNAANFDYAIFNFSTPSSEGNPSSINFYYRTSNYLDSLNADKNFLQYTYDPDIGIVSGESLQISSNFNARYIDIIAQLFASSDYQAAPVISSIALYYSIHSNNLGIIYDTNVNNATLIQYPRQQWNQGLSTNIQISQVPNNNTQSYQIGILNTANIGKYEYLSKSNLIISDSAYSEDLLIDINNNLYLSPYQVFASLPAGLLNPQHYVKTPAGNCLISDTDNDRILEIDGDGQLVKSIQGNIKLPRSTRDFVVLGAYYNTNTLQIYVAFSQYIALPQNYAEKLSIYVNGNIYSLTDPTYFNQEERGLFNINSNSASATFYATVTQTLNTIIVENDNNVFFQIQNTASAPPFGIPSSGRSDNFDLENETINYNNATFNEFSVNNSVGFGTILDYSAGIAITNLDPTIFGQNTNTPSDVLLSYTDIDKSPPYSNFYSIPVQVTLVFFDNIFKPIFVDTFGSENIIVTTVGNNAARAYDSSFNALYTLSLDTFSFNEKLGGSIYVMDKLPTDMGNHLLVSEPSIGVTTIVGNVYVYNRNSGTISNQFSYKGFDTVKSLPIENDFLILLYDRQANGLRSKLIRVGQDGRTNYAINNLFIKPVSLRIGDEGDYYVTDTTGQIGTIFERQFIPDGSGNSNGTGNTGNNNGGGGLIGP